MSTRKTITLDLPDAVLSIETIVNPFMGDSLCISLANGRQIVIDAMQMTPEHECQVGLWENFDSIADDGRLIAGISFNGAGAADTQATVLEVQG